MAKLIFEFSNIHGLETVNHLLQVNGKKRCVHLCKLDLLKTKTAIKMENTSRRQSCDTSSVPEIVVEPADDYTAAIELSNACREFYRNRVQATESFKRNLNNRNNDKASKTTRRTTIDDSMDKLRCEMVRKYCY